MDTRDYSEDSIISTADDLLEEFAKALKEFGVDVKLYYSNDSYFINYVRLSMQIMISKEANIVIEDRSKLNRLANCINAMRNGRLPDVNTDDLCELQNIMQNDVGYLPVKTKPNASISTSYKYNHVLDVDVTYNVQINSQFTTKEYVKELAKRFVEGTL